MNSLSRRTSKGLDSAEYERSKAGCDAAESKSSRVLRYIVGETRTGEQVSSMGSRY